MALYLNNGYTFEGQEIAGFHGSMIFASSMPMHQLQRRRIDDRYPMMQHRLFDPQLYLCGLDAHNAAKICTNMGTYPWFGATPLQFDSGEHSQSDWKKMAVETISDRWRQEPISDQDEIDIAVRSAVELQRSLGCEKIILPSPLTVEISSQYDQELAWLDAGLEASRELAEGVPVYATVAIQDFCLRPIAPVDNELLNMIADSVSARGVDGVYIVVEQASEPDDSRQCATERTLQSILHLTHLFSQDAGIEVMVNFSGVFGLACLAAGAKHIATGWYKSMYRMRLNDKIGTGRAYPSYWSQQSATHVHLDSDFDTVFRSGNAGLIETSSSSATILNRSSRLGNSVADVADWQFRQSNITASKNHFLEVMGREYTSLVSLTLDKQIIAVENWISDAKSNSHQLRGLLNTGFKTKLNHQSAWDKAFAGYKLDHDL